MALAVPIMTATGCPLRPPVHGDRCHLDDGLAIGPATPALIGRDATVPAAPAGRTPARCVTVMNGICGSLLIGQGAADRLLRLSWESPEAGPETVSRLLPEGDPVGSGAVGRARSTVWLARFLLDL